MRKVLAGTINRCPFFYAVNEEEIKKIELRRLQELRKQQAAQGPNTPPHILVEIQELSSKYKRQRNGANRYAQLDYDFLMDTVAATLQRFNVIEDQFKKDAKTRQTRQKLLDMWLTVISVLLIVLIVLVLFRL